MLQMFVQLPRGSIHCTSLMGHAQAEVGNARVSCNGQVALGQAAHSPTKQLQAKAQVQVHSQVEPTAGTGRSTGMAGKRMFTVIYMWGLIKSLQV